MKLNLSTDSKRLSPLIFFLLLLTTLHCNARNCYQPLDAETVKQYLLQQSHLNSQLGGLPSEWASQEVGDGNLNLVFIVKGPNGALLIKQALPYVRCVGESWPLPLSRSEFEYAALLEEAQYATDYVPALFYHDEEMALTAMEYLTPHTILRKGLIAGIRYPEMAEHLGRFLALTLYHTSDLFLSSAEKREKMRYFALNHAMCKISEDLIFDEPYYDATLNHWTRPELDDIALEFRSDQALKRAAQEMKWRFLTHAEAMVHGDLHTGSIMVTDKDTRVIDPEFAFYGPMGFDIGALMANLLLAYFSQPGHAETMGARDEYAAWILEQVSVLWRVFASTFADLVQADRGKRGIYAECLSIDASFIVENHLKKIWEDSLGFAAVKMIRRIFGLAHVEDFESIKDPTARAALERNALIFARSLLLNCKNYPMSMTPHFDLPRK